jgi:CRP-like cAMP-binding protein
MRLANTDALNGGGVLAVFGRETKASPHRKKQTIFSQGDRNDSMFYVVNGSVKLALVSRAGNEAVITIVGPGKLFGESCISNNDPLRFQSAVALTDVRLMKIESTAILRLLRSGGDTSVNLISAILRQNTQIQEDLAKRLVDSAEESLARVISSLVQFRERDASLPRVSQQTIAEMMGITRQRVNVLMKRFGLTLASGSARAKKSRPSKSSSRKP